MVQSFFATTQDDWTDPSGMLHAYIVPSSVPKQRLAEAAATLTGLSFVAPQPTEALHGTIQRFPFLLRDLDQDAIDQLETSAQNAAAKLQPFDLSFGAARVTKDSVLASAEIGPSWEALVKVTRSAAQAALGPEALRYDPPFGPHMTLAYAVSDGPDEEIDDALRSGPGTSEPIGPVTVGEIVWCAVHQNRNQGTYTFEPLFSTALGEDLGGR
ncbi:MAG: 2'-5' RNA ligase family protein [Ancrocorticia sp.]|uniref:2'-5' RNA ligase family protein n=1 Tax=Ancrocorticia sp. TaxID=2593684 RepID=UPI003F92031F